MVEWRITRTVVVFLLAATGLNAQAKLGSGTSTPLAGDSRWQTYRNPVLGFELELPAGWTVSSTEPFGDLVWFQPPPDEKMLSEFSFGPVQPVRDAWFQDFADWLREYKRELVVAGSSMRSQGRLRVSGYEAVRLTYAERGDGKSSMTIDVLIAQPRTPQGIVFRFLYGPPTDRKYAAEQHAIYRRILSSLRIAVPK